MATVVDVNEQCPRMHHPSDTSWLIAHALKVLMMQAGFALVESSFVRQKNSANIMMKNVSDLCVGVLFFWAVGWGLAYGVDPDDPENVNGFAGTGEWFLRGTSDYGGWLFQLSFAATAATIDSGAVAERMNFKPYIIYSSLLTGIFYPIVCHWCWDQNGWLAKMGFHDFAGSGVVHLLGGTSALCSAWFLGPRMGRFEHAGQLEVEVVGGENLGAAAARPGHARNGLEGERGTRRRSLPLAVDAGAAGEALPYVMVQQLNHGRRTLRTRHAETTAHPRWGSLLRFKIHPSESGTEEQTAWWRRLLGQGGQEQAAQGRAGAVEVCAAFRQHRAAKDNVGRWAWEMAESEIPAALRLPGATAEIGHVGTELEQFESTRSAGSSTAGREDFQLMWCKVRGAALELGVEEGGSVTRRVAWRSVERVERGARQGRTVTIRTHDGGVIELRGKTAEDSDAWFDAVCKAWRPALTPIRLRAHVLDHVTNTPLGHAELVISASDKPDPEKFRVSSMLRLSCGGRLELYATYTSAERRSREVFQSWDPVKLLFGTFVLWISWFSFNAGSTYGVVNGKVELATMVSVTTVLAACAGGTTAMIASELTTGSIMCEHLSAGILGALVAICGGCAVVSAWEAAVIGSAAALLALGSTRVMAGLEIDDPCASVPIHAVCGLWGVVAVGLFAEPEACVGIAVRGLFRGGGWRQLGVQLLGALAVAAWGSAMCFTVLVPLDWLARRVAWLHWLRIRASAEDEEVGFDQSEHNIHRPSAKALPVHPQDNETGARKRWGTVRSAFNLKAAAGGSRAASLRTLQDPLPVQAASSLEQDGADHEGMAGSLSGAV